MINELRTIREDFNKELAEVSNSDDVLALKQTFLGKNSLLVKAKKQIGGLDPSERKIAGEEVKSLKTYIQDKIESASDSFNKKERLQKLESERMDLSETIDNSRVGSKHIITQTWEELEDVFIGMGFIVADGPQIETEWHNFDALNIPSGHPAREEFDTLYVDYGKAGSTLLRTHTSPVQIRAMQTQEPPIYLVAPGRVFRRDTADATHMPVFHQIEGLVVDEGISMADLKGTIDEFTSNYFGREFTSRLRPNHFPFTEPSAEYDIKTPAGDWLELGGAGMVHPNVLDAVGIDKNKWSGFAFGFGIDRLALMKFGVSDLRDLYTNDLRFLSQF